MKTYAIEIIFLMMNLIVMLGIYGNCVTKIAYRHLEQISKD